MSCAFVENGSIYFLIGELQMEGTAVIVKKELFCRYIGECWSHSFVLQIHRHRFRLGHKSFAAKKLVLVQNISCVTWFLDIFYSPVPPEIHARGIEAEHAFQRALKKGKVRVYRGRVMLIGQNRAGKTSLKKSLLGLKFDPGEQSTEGIEVDPSRFELDVDRVMNWQLVKNEKFTSEFADDIARLVVGELRSGDEEKKPETSVEVETAQTDVTQGASAPQRDQVQ